MYGQIGHVDGHIWLELSRLEHLRCDPSSISAHLGSVRAALLRGLHRNCSSSGMSEVKVCTSSGQARAEVGMVSVQSSNSLWSELVSEL